MRHRLACRCRCRASGEVRGSRRETEHHRSPAAVDRLTQGFDLIRVVGFLLAFAVPGVHVIGLDVIDFPGGVKFGQRVVVFPATVPRRIDAVHVGKPIARSSGCEISAAVAREFLMGEFSATACQGMPRMT